MRTASATWPFWRPLLRSSITSAGFSMSFTKSFACAPVTSSRRWNQTSFGMSTAPVKPGPVVELPVEAGVEDRGVLHRIG